MKASSESRPGVSSRGRCRAKQARLTHYYGNGDLHKIRVLASIVADDEAFVIASAERANATSIWLGFVAVNILHQIWAIAATLLAPHYTQSGGSEFTSKDAALQGGIQQKPLLG
jgi:hypothetical protein